MGGVRLPAWPCCGFDGPSRTFEGLVHGLLLYGEDGRHKSSDGRPVRSPVGRVSAIAVLIMVDFGQPVLQVVVTCRGPGVSHGDTRRTSGNAHIGRTIYSFGTPFRSQSASWVPSARCWVGVTVNPQWALVAA